MYLFRDKYIAIRSRTIHASVGAIPVWFAWLLAVLLLISSGLTYRILASCIGDFVKVPIKLPVPLSTFPIQIGDWIGRDVPIAEKILRVAANDDSLNRLYVNDSDNQMVNVYIAYTARPRTMLGHRPLVCYPAGGWILEDTRKAEVISNSGMKVPCLIHRFHKPSPYYEQTVVLNFYIVNGQLTSDESVFSGLDFRTPNIAGDPARYAAQVQVSSISEHSIRAATRDMVELMLDMFPDKNGKVKAADFREIDVTSNQSE